MLEFSSMLLSAPSPYLCCILCVLVWSVLLIHVARKRSVLLLLIQRIVLNKNLVNFFLCFWYWLTQNHVGWGAQIPDGEGSIFGAPPCSVAFCQNSFTSGCGCGEVGLQKVDYQVVWENAPVSKVDNNNNNSYDSVYGDVIITKVIVRVHPVHLMNVDWVPGGRQSSDQASQPGLWVRW